MTTFEIIYNIVVLFVTAGTLMYLHHLVKTSGTDPIVDPERAQRFMDTAPYHLLRR